MATTEVHGACALDCPDCCSWTVTVTDGKAVKLRGKKDHPFTRGGLCAKVNPYLEYAARPDRLLVPQRRVGPKGAGRFEPISWDEALGEWADRWRDILDTDGGNAIWPFGGTGNLGLLQGIESGGVHRLANHLGLARHHASICSVAGTIGTLYSAGTPMTFGPEEFATDTGLVVLWGANPLVSHQHLWPFIEQARERGAPIVVIDPVRTRSAQRGDVHLAPRPGTDGALALGVMAELVAQGHVDDHFVEHRAEGFDEFVRNELSNWSAGRAAEICDLRVGEVIDLVDLIVEHRPVGIKLSMGMQRHAGGGQAARVISAIPAITGDHDRPGGGLLYSTSSAFRLAHAELQRDDLSPHTPRRTLVMTRLADTLLEAEPPVRSLFVFGANPVVSNPDQQRVRRALSRDDLFTVVVDHLQTPTADYADLLLPTTTQLEHHELLGSYGHLYLHWNEAAVEPPGECLPLTEMMRRLATALGLDEPALFASDLDLARDALDADHDAVADITLDDLRARGWVRLGYPSPYAAHADGFATPSGRFEFASELTERDGQGRFPHYVPPAEATSVDDEHPFALVSPADASMLNSVFAAPGRSWVSVHAKDAAAIGVVDGDLVEIGNRRGCYEAVARLDDRARRGVLVGVKGQWPADEASSVNATVDERDADMGSGAVYHDNKVWVRPLSP